jgi:EAL domain-containing protein (putative c-di-GMP-specific phosphodiesterase class I)
VRLLKDLGCDQIQGYLVSRPVPAQEVEALLRAHVSRTGQGGGVSDVAS